MILNLFPTLSGTSIRRTLHPSLFIFLDLPNPLTQILLHENRSLVLD
jgi:hypothetical protein